MKKVLFVLALLLCPANVYAQRVYAEMPESVLLLRTAVPLQTHPCDAAPPGNTQITSSQPLIVGFCSTNKDLDGNPTDVSQLRITVDSANVYTGQMPAAIGAPSSSGVNYYEQKIVLVQQGQHQVVVFLTNASGETGSDPFAFVLKGAAPAKPSVATVKKSVAAAVKK